jgi:hypothetical protein
MSRKIYHYDEKLGRMVEGPGRSRSEGSGDGWRFSDRSYSATPFKAHDGTVIDSKAKHRDYMKRHGLTTADDFTGEWARAKVKRESVYQGTHEREARREAIAHAIEKHSSRGR